MASAAMAPAPVGENKGERGVGCEVSGGRCPRRLAGTQSPPPGACALPAGGRGREVSPGQGVRGFCPPLVFALPSPFSLSLLSLPLFFTINQASPHAGRPRIHAQVERRHGHPRGDSDGGVASPPRARPGWPIGAGVCRQGGPGGAARRPGCHAARLELFEWSVPVPESWARAGRWGTHASLAG